VGAKPTTLDELEAKIHAVIQNIQQNEPELIQRCILSVRRRAEACIAENGGVFEMYL